MRRRTLLPLVLMFAASALWAKGKVEIPDVILNSTYVMVTTYDGDPFSPDLIPEFRQAVADVQQAIEQWGRDKLVYSSSGSGYDPGRANRSGARGQGRFTKGHQRWPGPRSG